MDRLSGVCLERRLELASAVIDVRDWPGLAGPLIHVPDPMRGSSTVEVLAAALAPAFRVLSIRPRAERPYQVQVDDLEGVLNQFGFEHVVLAAEGLSCASALLAAGWYPHRIRTLVLIDPTREAPHDERLLARSLRDCPPDWDQVRQALHCPVVEFAGESPPLVPEIERLLTSGLP